jgi:glycosyltransferase involved in cell wall biosynthesis
MNVYGIKNINLSIAIFAHNEENNVSNIINDVICQDIFQNSAFAIEVHILANGCSDKTVEFAKEAIAKIDETIKEKFFIHDLMASGKSRTWNDFVHRISNSSSDFLIFVDGDIVIHQNFSFSTLAANLTENANLQIVSSRPVKNLTLADHLSVKQKIMVAGTGTLNNWKKSVAGSLYAVRAGVARKIWMPIGLPVEDGFLRAIVLTDCLTEDEDLSRIDGSEILWHEYASVETFVELVHHQTRIIIGSAINAVIFSVIRREASKPEAAYTFLQTVAQDEDWLSKIESAELPRFPYGYVPFSFLVKRIQFLLISNKAFRVSNVFKALFGFLFDLLVYIIATLRMARSGGAGFW